MSTLELDRNLARCQLPELDTKDIHWVIRQARRELRARHEEKWALKERVEGGVIAMSNFMAGVAWAMACRASLRIAHGHLPSGGKAPASGEVWLPRELLLACRGDIKERGWSPLTSPNWGHFRQQQLAWLNRRYPELSRREAIEKLDEDYAGQATAFHVRMAAPQCGVLHFDENVLTGRS